MNISENIGESSCKRQENGDATQEPDRPLKKARFAWEVKGKYHLRNDITDGKSNQIGETDTAGSSKQESKLVGRTEQNLEILGDYLLKQDFNSLDSISDNNASLLPSSSTSQKLSYPRYISTFESSRDTSESSGSTNSDKSIPNSMVYSSKEVEDQCIARWQARQMAKCFVDNTINRVLDSWMLAPLPADMDNNRVLALDAAEFINNLPGDNSIENEAILMAISAHGLQNNSGSSNDNSGTDQCDSSKHIYMSAASSPIPSDDESPDINLESKLQTECSSNNLDMSWTYADDIEHNSNNNSPLKFYPETSSSSYQFFSETDNLNNSNIEYEAEDNETHDNNIANNHYDFLDAAVSFAIQYKGLTSYGTDYG
ncbi:unnamed protein product [Danaus chrysippus]|uniref:(African queen) hypothetical protein n=1 Tax=Danaus chrysippus TaxID=151541 RepID=A0A8J2VSG7_9NEOP|nr:unnamed protein product [Danaus chrysippus]